MSVFWHDGFPTSGDARTFLASVLRHISPVQRMWPWFWLKLLAIRLDDQLVVAYLGCVGLCDADEQTAQKRSRVLSVRRDGVMMLSRPAPADQVLDWWKTWAQNNPVSWDEHAISMNGAQAAFYTQHVVPSAHVNNHRLTEVVEPFPYTWFHGSIDYELTDHAKTSADWARFDRAVRDIEPSGLGVLVQRNFGEAIRWPHGRVEVLLPLPLSWSLDAEDIVFRAHGQLPLLQQLDVRSSSDGRWSDDNQPATVDHTGRASLPRGWRRLWVRHPFLDSAIVLDAEDHNLIAKGGTQVLSAVYRVPSEDLYTGIAHWRDKLRDGDARQQELAIANGLARFGIPVLFGGTALSTPGFDLAVLDVYRSPRHVLLVEVSTEQGPGLQKKANKLSEIVSSIETTLTSWTCRGVLVVSMSEERVAGLSLPSNVRAVTLQAMQELLDDDGLAPERVLEGLCPEPIETPVWIPNESFQPGRG
jgi:hypothetical protein